jgi:hypothetical protein
MNQTYIIYQNDLRPIQAELNTLVVMSETFRPRWEKAAEKFPQVRAHLATSFEGSKGFEPAMSSVYREVARIQAESLEDVFAISNLQDREDQVLRSRSMHSLSVGDVVRGPTGAFYMVDPVGFARIEFDEDAQRIAEVRERVSRCELRIEDGGRHPVLNKPAEESLFVLRVIQDGRELSMSYGFADRESLARELAELRESYRRSFDHVFVNDRRAPGGES